MSVREILSTFETLAEELRGEGERQHGPTAYRLKCAEAEALHALLTLRDLAGAVALRDRAAKIARAGLNGVEARKASERAAEARRLKAERPDMTLKEIARSVGVGVRCIQKYLAERN